MYMTDKLNNSDRLVIPPTSPAAYEFRMYSQCFLTYCSNWKARSIFFCLSFYLESLLEDSSRFFLFDECAQLIYHFWWIIWFYSCLMKLPHWFCYLVPAVHRLENCLRHLLGGPSILCRLEVGIRLILLRF